MTLREMLVDLLDQAKSGMPSAKALEAHYEPKSKGKTVAGPNLSHPSWATRVSTAADVYLDLDGDLAGVYLHEDSRGWGAYAEVSVIRGTLDDVEAVVGKMQLMPRAPGAFSAGDKLAAYVPLAGKTVRVFAELVKRGPAVARLTVHFQR